MPENTVLKIAHIYFNNTLTRQHSAGNFSSLQSPDYTGRVAPSNYRWIYQSTINYQITLHIERVSSLFYNVNIDNIVSTLEQSIKEYFNPRVIMEVIKL